MGNQILKAYVRPKHSTGIHVLSSFGDPERILYVAIANRHSFGNSELSGFPIRCKLVATRLPDFVALVGGQCPTLVSRSIDTYYKCVYTMRIIYTTVIPAISGNESHDDQGI